MHLAGAPAQIRLPSMVWRPIFVVQMAVLDSFCDKLYYLALKTNR